MDYIGNAWEGKSLGRFKLRNYTAMFNIHNYTVHSHSTLTNGYSVKGDCRNKGKTERQVKGHTAVDKCKKVVWDQDGGKQRHRYSISSKMEPYRHPGRHGIQGKK